MRIGSKAEMYDLLQRGRLGNRLRIWSTDASFLSAVNDGFGGHVGVRCVGAPGLPYYHRKHPDEAIELGRILRAELGCDVVYYEASPDEYITIQGELCESDHGPMLEWSTARTHMRAALSQERHMLYGPGVRALLRHVLSPASYDDMLAVGEMYPGVVIEFTAYEILLGDLRGRNAVVWEARHY